MKKFARKSLALLLVIVMTASICCSFVTVSATTVAGDVDYSVSSGFHTLSFNPENGYIAVPYSKNGRQTYAMGTIKTLAASEYCSSSTATAAPGFINASYFDMTTGALNGSNMTNGRFIVWSEPWQFSDSEGYYEPLILFRSDGSITGVDSNLDVTATGTGFSINASYINKNSYFSADLLYYFDSNYGSSVSMSSAGEFLVIEKDNQYLNLGLNVPYTGKVVKTVEGTSCTLSSDQFVLYIRHGSYSSGGRYFSEAVAGTSVSVVIKETRTAAKAEMTDDVIGIIQSTGYLIKDGVKMTSSLSYIGPATHNGDTEGAHSTSLSRGWTAMGIEDDGTIHLIVSNGTSTLSAAATYLYNLGCTTAFRMDSGGSSQMTVSSTTYYAEGARNVPEGILIANTSMMGKSAVKTELGNLIADVEDVLGADSTLPELVEARANYEGTIQADQRKSIGKLIQLLTAKGLLSALVDSANSADISGYTDYKADLIQTTVLEGERLVNSSTSTDAQCEALAAKLSEYMNGTYSGGRLSLGAAYKTGTVNTAYPDTDGTELTNGDLYEVPLSSSSARWVGFHKDSAVGSNSAGSFAEVYVDLGEATTITAASVSARNYTAWGISAPKTVEVLVSEDGKNFSKYLTLQNTFDAIDAVDQVMLYTGEKSVTARYFAFRAYFADNSDHVFLGEVSLYGAASDAAVFAPVDVMNTYVDGTNTTTIFTSAFASSLTESNSNLNWCNVAVCDYDSEAGAYVVTAFYQNRGSSTSVTVPSDGFVAAFFAEDGWALSNHIQVGDCAYINGTHLSAAVFDACARVAFKAPTDVVIGDYEVIVETIVSAGNGVASPDDDYLRLLGDDVTVNQLLAVSNDKGITVTINGVTVTGNTKIVNGAVITDSNGITYIAYIVADANGDNKVSPLDYITMKRAFMGTKEIEGLQLKAACLSGGDSVSAVDYIMLKRYFLGTYELQ